MIIHFNQFYVTNLLSNILLAPRKFTRYFTMKRSSLKLNLFASLHSAHKSCSSAAGRSAKSVLLIVSRRVTWNSYSYTQHIYMYRVSGQNQNYNYLYQKCNDLKHKYVCIFFCEKKNDGKHRLVHAQRYWTQFCLTRYFYIRIRNRFRSIVIIRTIRVNLRNLVAVAQSRYFSSNCSII